MLRLFEKEEFATFYVFHSMTALLKKRYQPGGYVVFSKPDVHAFMFFLAFVFFVYCADKMKTTEHSFGA